MVRQGIFRAGTSGLVLAEKNKSAYPEAFRKRSRLSYYSTLFNTIEINSSFYKLPMPGTFAKWAEEVDDSFRFTVKLLRDITHASQFGFHLKDIDKFMLAADKIGPKKGCLLIQLPPSLDYAHAGRLEEMIRRIRMTDTGETWDLAVEFRHSSWYREEIYKLLDRYHAGVVLQDMPASATGELNEKAPIVYLRFHGPAGDYKGGYPGDFLQKKADEIRKWLQEGKDVYTYFNNTIGDAVSNLVDLKKMVG